MKIDIFCFVKTNKIIQIVTKKFILYASKEIIYIIKI